jgi:putative spermidine/putrescine transport system permease protein
MGTTTRLSRIALAAWAALIVLFLLFPIALIALYAFNPSNVQSWPLDGLSTKWFSEAFHDEAMREALWLSLRAAFISTAIALVLGSLAAFAVHRFRFFGRETVSFVILLPLALPGIITGMALNSFFTFGGVDFSLTTIVIGHATFCIVTVYNNVLARMRRTPTSLVEASMDLGADGWQTFRHVTLPMIATALVAGGLLAFALSFDEVIVTTYTAGAQNTLPLWIFGNIRLGQELPLVNVVVLFVIALTLIPVALAQRLTRDTGALRPVARGRAADGDGATAGPVRGGDALAEEPPGG